MSGTDWRSLREQLAEFDADPRSQLAGLQDLIQRCQDGINTEVNTARGDIVALTQKRPEIELQARRLLRDAVNDILDRADQDDLRDRQIQGSNGEPELTVRFVKAVPSE